MNLLCDDLFRVALADRTARVCLPELLALLGDDQVASLPGVQRHQEDALYVFLCYLAGAVLNRAEQANPRQNADFWRAGIRHLTQAEGCDNDDAWTLVVADPTRPAFLQPPAPSKAVFDKEYKSRAAAPAQLDVLQTAKNHDVKAARGDPRDAEAWCLALLTLQTQISYMGSGKYGIVRMNGGFASRPYIGWLPARRPGVRFLHELTVLLQQREALLTAPWSYQVDGKVLLWLPAWDGQTSLSLTALDPFFIEIARRVRLVHANDNALSALAATAKTTRLAAKDLKGNLGDPWIPITIKTGGALTVQENGFTPQRLRDLIFGDGEVSLAAMQHTPPGQPAGWFAASVLVRGKCTTDGFHERCIRVPEKARSALFGKHAARDRLAILSKKGLDMASSLQFRILQPALFALLEGGPESINLDKREIRQWVEKSATRYTQDWHPRYFDWLWNTVDASDETTALRTWFHTLRPLAESTLDTAFHSAPSRGGRTWRARSKAVGMFRSGLVKHFNIYLERTHEPR